MSLFYNTLSIEIKTCMPIKNFYFAYHIPYSRVMK